MESIYQDKPTDREFGTLTMSLTKSEFEEIKFKLRQMRKGLNKDNSIARMKSKGERVYQLNIQLFPVTNAVEGVQAAPVIQSALDVKNGVIVETSKEVAEAVVATVAEAAAPAPQAPAQPQQPPQPAKERSNVSSLAATAASAADLFR